MVDHGAKESGVNISSLCERAGMSRQNYYAVRRERHRRQIDEDLVVELVKQNVGFNRGLVGESFCI